MGENKNQGCGRKSREAVQEMYEKCCLELFVMYMLLLFFITEKSFLLKSCFYLFFYPLKRSLSALYRWILTLGIKKLSVLARCPLYSVRFIEVSLCVFIRKTAGTEGFCPS